ncbi:RND transporter [Cellulophaga lytica]|uniref:efflux RND transporter periplasmic adaptor subunit n=1 Tax=Cellulophaga lytica TaxID=979 RepID=UPI0004F5CE0B|nr:efflux RND transporter periplasmic adaptor subunit [Cellulophaga lytica]AIM62017.1 RND transporter [Cellulophaga lytica]
MKNNVSKLALVVLLLAVFSCKEEKKEAVKTASKNSATTFNLKKEVMESTIVIPAELNAFTYVDMYAKVSSYVKTLKVDIGSKVKKGQLLISLEAPEITSKLLAAEAQLHAAEAVYMASKNTYNRLLETSKTEGTISKNQMELALATKNTDNAKLQAAKATYKEYQVMQSYLQIKAPFTGIVTARNVNIGAYVGPSGKGSELPLVTVQDVKKLRLGVSVPENYAGYIHTGDEINFRVNSIPGKTFTANVARMSGALDNKLRSERIEIDIENNPLLKPGMVAEVTLNLQTKEPLYVVPKSAVMTYSEGSFVIKSVKGKAQKVAVTKRRETNGKMEVFSNELHENDQLLTVASEEIRNGDALSVM